MDNLEKELLESLLAEKADDFSSDRDRDQLLDQLKGPIELIKQLEVAWVRHLPKSTIKHWDSLSLPTRFLAWVLCMEIESVEIIAEDYKQAFYDASK